MFRGLLAEAGFFVRTFTDVILGAVASALVFATLVVAVPAVAAARSSPFAPVPTAPPDDPSDRPPSTVNFLYQPPPRLACGPIELAYDPKLEPYAAVADVAAAASRLESVTGRVVSVFTGDRSALPTEAITVTVSWVPDLDAYGVNVAGIGVPTLLGDRLVGGHVELDAAAHRGPERLSLSPVLDHELGHALFGFDHSPRSTDLMFPTITSSSAFSTDETLALGWVSHDPACSVPEPRSLSR